LTGKGSRQALARDALALLALAAFCAALLRKTLLQGGAMLGYDLYTYFYPAKAYAAAALLRGELPLWNPFIYLGAPFLANVQMAALYPPDLLFLTLSFPQAVAWSQWLHLCAGAAGMYALCRWGWGLDATGGLVGAVAFAGSGFLGAHMGHMNQVHASVWLPWIALCYWRLAALVPNLAALAPNLAARWRRRRCASGPHVGAPPVPPPACPAGRPGERRHWAPWLVAGGVAVALQLTAGHTQEAYYSLFALGLLALGFTVFPPARAPRRWAHLPALAALAANGALLAGAQLLPAVELARLSYRQGGIPLEEAVAYAVSRTNILETVLPTFWSLPSQEVTGYVGVVALPLAVAGIAASAARRTVLALAVLAALSLTLSLGLYTPLYALLYAWVPLFDSFRAPGRWLLIWTFALAGLAAHGATALRYGQPAAARERLALRYAVALCVAAGALLLFAARTNYVHAIQWLPQARVALLWGLAAVAGSALGLLGLLSPLRAVRLALPAALAIELALAAREMEYNRPGPAALYLEPPAVATYLRQSLGEGAGGARVVSLAVEERLDAERLGRAVPHGTDDEKRYASMRESLKPNLGVAYGLPTVDGYDGGLLPTRVYAQWKSLLITAEPAVPHYTLPAQAHGRADAALLATLGVRFLLTDGRNGPPGPGWRLRDDAPGAAWLYENEHPHDRARLVTEVVVEPDADAALERLRTLDLQRAAIVDRPVALPRSPAPAPEHAGLAQEVRLVRYSAQEVVLETRSPAPALLVLADSAYPGWRSTVDGRPAEVVRANRLLRAVAVPAGIHQVRFWFDPWSVKLGLAVSALAIGANALLLAWWRRGRPLAGASRGGASAGRAVGRDVDG
jgi:hypothetical protein